MTSYARSEAFRLISLISKSGVLIQDILSVSSLKTNHIIEITESLSNNEVSSIIQHSMKGSFSELILQ